jgi:hypothetical protein
MARTIMPPDRDPIADDYVIEREDERPTPPVSIQVVRVLRLFMVAILAIASLALFWIVATMLGLF